MRYILGILKTMLLSLCFLLVYSSVFVGYSQDKTSKNKVRLKADFFNDINGEEYIQIGAISRINKKNVAVKHIDLNIINKYYDESIELGSIKAGMDGECKYVLTNFDLLKADSSNVYTIDIKFKGNDEFKSASKSISFKKANIVTNLVTKDSINYVTATLTDKATDSIIEGESLVVQVERLFKPLKIGENLHFTDKNGNITVPINNDIPGIDGIITVEVVLKDHDLYGTVKASFDASIGIPIKEESTFDERTMWSPRSKTPIFLLIIPNLLTFGIWGIIFYLIFSLFKIYRS